jgi:hypothetical protein
MTVPVRALFTGIAFGAMLVAPTVASGQTVKRIVITPYAGVYAPTTNLAEVGAAAGGASASLNLKQKTALALGANASFWFTDRTALEVGAAYAYSDAKGSVSLSGTGQDFSGTVSNNAYAILTSAKFMLSMLPSTSAMNLRLGIGPALVTRGGSAYKSDELGKFTGLTDVGGVVSLCTKIPVTKLVAVRLRGESFMYSAKLGFKDPVDPTNNFKFDSRFQNDLLFSAGLQFAFGR